MIILWNHGPSTNSFFLSLFQKKTQNSGLIAFYIDTHKTKNNGRTFNPKIVCRIWISVNGSKRRKREKWKEVTNLHGVHIRSIAVGSASVFMHKIFVFEFSSRCLMLPYFFLLAFDCLCAMEIHLMVHNKCG